MRATRAMRPTIALALLLGVVLSWTGTAVAARLRSSAASSDNSLGLTIDPYNDLALVSAQRVGRTQFLYTYQATVENRSGNVALNVTAAVTSSSPTTVVEDGSLAFGYVNTYYAQSTDTFSILQDRSVPFDPTVLSFTFYYDVGPPEQVVVPYVTGLDQSTAEDVIAEANLAIGSESTDFSASIAAGDVISQNPPADTPVDAQSSVDLVVSSGPEFTLELPKPYVDIPQGGRLLVPVSVRNYAGYVAVSIAPDSAPFHSNQFQVLSDPQTFWLTVSVDSSAPLGGPVDVQVVGQGYTTTSEIPLHVRVVAPLPTSQGLIAQDLAAGAIDYGTSLLYRYYALFGDARLPAQYHGGGSLGEDPTLDFEVEQAASTLAPDLVGEIAPFRLRPDDPGSAWGWDPAPSDTSPSLASRSLLGAAPATTLTDVIGQLYLDCYASTAPHEITGRHPTFPVRLHAFCPGDPGDDYDAVSSAELALDTLDAVWAQMTGLMGDPLPDGTLGGDDALDYYILTPNPTSASFATSRSLTLNPQADGQTVGDGGIDYVVIDGLEFLDPARFSLVLIHETFHVLQDKFTLNLGEFRCFVGGCVNGAEEWWFTEASARWAETHFAAGAPQLGLSEAARDVYAANFDQFTARKTGLVQSNLITSAAVSIQDAYNAAMWPLFAEFTTGSSQFMQDIWFSLAASLDFDAMDAVVDQAFGFADHWKSFALTNLNQTFVPGDPLPYPQRYASFDGAFPDDQKPNHSGSEFQFGAETAGIEFSLPSLSSHYFVIDADNVGLAGIKEVKLDWRSLADAPGIDVQAIYKDSPNGVWKYADLSDLTHASLCITAPGPSALQAWIVISNADSSNAELAGDLEETALVTQDADCNCPIRAGDQYCFTELPAGPFTPNFGDFASDARRINANGVVAGDAAPALGAAHQPATWQAGQLRLVSTPHGGGAYGINDDGDLAGFDITDDPAPGQGIRATLWLGGKAFALDALVGLSQGTEANAINNLGTIVGDYVAAGTQDALIWEHCAPDPVTGALSCPYTSVLGPDEYGADVNDEDQVLITQGSSSGFPSAIVINLVPKPGEPAEVDLGPGNPIAINNRGEVLIDDDPYTQSKPPRVLQVSTGLSRTLACPVAPCVPMGLNNRGEAVGFAGVGPVKWDRLGNLVPLPTSAAGNTPSGPTFYGFEPHAIDDDGEITGEAVKNFTAYGWHTGFLLTPLGK